MTSEFEIKWHTRPAVGLTFYDGTNKVMVNHDQFHEDPLPIAIRKLRRELARTFPAHEIVVDEALQLQSGVA